MVDEESLPRRGRSHCQSVLADKHVDEARLADIRPADEGVFWKAILWTAGNIGVADDESGAFYLHVQTDSTDFRHKDTFFL